MSAILCENTAKQVPVSIENPSVLLNAESRESLYYLESRPFESASRAKDIFNNSSKRFMGAENRKSISAVKVKRVADDSALENKACDRIIKNRSNSQTGHGTLPHFCVIL